MVLKNKWIEWSNFLHAGANSGKLKVISDFWVDVVKNEYGHLFSSQDTKIWHGDRDLYEVVRDRAGVFE